MCDYRFTVKGIVGLSHRALLRMYEEVQSAVFQRGGGDGRRVVGKVRYVRRSL